MTTFVTGLYRHYKGQYYWALGLARHRDTEEVVVVYMPLYFIPENLESGVQMSVGPLEAFTKDVVETDRGKAPRFMYVGPR